MPTVVILDNENATLWFHQESKIVHHHIKKWVSGTDLRSILDKGSDCVKNNGATKWLSDDRLNGALKADDEEWAKTVWFPKTLKAGWKDWAVVLPEKLVGQMNLKRFTEDYAKAGINAQIFSDPDVARKWLETR